MPEAQKARNFRAGLCALQCKGMNAAIACSLLLVVSSAGAFAENGEGQGESPAVYTVKPGTHIPLGLINSVSTKHSVAGDRIYLETVFPIVIDSHIVIPPGSYVTGTVTEVKRPGRVKGRGELYVRFDSITLPNGITRDFRSRLGSVDARSGEKLDPKEGQVVADSNKGGDVRTAATTGVTGASIGAIAGSTAAHAAMGAGIGAAAGVAAGMVAVLF